MLSPLLANRSGSLLGFNYRFPAGLSAHHRLLQAAARRVTERVARSSGCPAWRLFPVASPCSLGCSAFSRAKPWRLLPISQDQITNGETLAAGERIKERAVQRWAEGTELRWKRFTPVKGRPSPPAPNSLRQPPGLTAQSRWESLCLQVAILESKRVRSLGSARTQQTDTRPHASAHNRHR